MAAAQATAKSRAAAPRSPTDTVTFLFTDIDGRTRLWESHFAAMKLALARHDAIMRARIEAHRGRVFKTAGDAFCAIFESASRAVDAARDAQRALLEQAWPSGAPIRVRMAVSSGDAEARDGDYYGPALNVASRLLSAARGGQTLVSASAAKALAGTAHIDRPGHYRLKGVQSPVEVFEVVVAEARFPPAENAQCYRVVRVHDSWQPAHPRETSRARPFIRLPLRSHVPDLSR